LVLLVTMFIVEVDFDSKQTVFFLALAAMIAPVLQRFYDAVVVLISKIVRSDGFTWKGTCFALGGLIVFLPTMIANLLGADLGFEGKLGEGAGDDINKLSTKYANEGLIHEVEQDQAEVVSNLFWVNAIRAEDNKRARDANVVKAARAIQEKWRLKREASHEPARGIGVNPRDSACAWVERHISEITRRDEEDARDSLDVEELREDEKEEETEGDGGDSVSSKTSSRVRRANSRRNLSRVWKLNV